MHTVDASAWFPQLSASPLRHTFAQIGELFCFRLFEVTLTSSTVFTVGFASIRTLGTCVRVPDASEISPAFLAPLGAILPFP